MPPAEPGAVWDGGRTTVSVRAPGADALELCMAPEGEAGEYRVEMVRGDDGWWTAASERLVPGGRYGLRAHGPRHNPRRLLLDPAAQAVSGGIDWDQVRFEDPMADTGPYVPWSVVVDWADLPDVGRGPAADLADAVIYEANVRSLTALHPDVPPEDRGTYRGLAHPAVIEHLVALGVTAVELLPVAQFVHSRALWSNGLRNLWGYDPVAWMAPHNAYASGDRGQQVHEFAAAVAALHGAGLDVFLDVVFNHTGEAGPDGPTVCFRGLDDAGWYRHHPDDSGYQDFTGCSNTVDMRPPANRAMVVHALRHWADRFGIDGFRFDLASALLRGDDGSVDPAGPLVADIAADPVLSTRVMIAEPWDAAPGGYCLGGFPSPWVEWNDRFRTVVRDVWRGRGGPRRDLATRLAGSSDLFSGERGPEASVNFVTAHDGFTLLDLVSYEDKHNRANGEDNRDGTDDNRSSNGGVEGPTDDPHVEAARARRRRNLMGTLAVSLGVPMVLAGDEIGNTQHGSNNAYAQDNEVSWLDWAHADTDFLEFVRRALWLRRLREDLRHEDFLSPDEVHWCTPEGHELDVDLWAATDDPALVLVHPDLVVALNPGSTHRTLALPEGAPWTVSLDSTTPDGAGAVQGAVSDSIELPADSLLVLSR